MRHVETHQGALLEPVAPRTAPQPGIIKLPTPETEHGMPLIEIRIIIGNGNFLVLSGIFQRDS